jgi:hypothetical protein
MAFRKIVEKEKSRSLSATDALLSPVHLLLVSLLAQLSTPYQQENFQALLAARLADESKALYRNRWKSYQFKLDTGQMS